MSRAKYAPINPAFWKKGMTREIVKQGSGAALLAVYLRTNTRINMIGLYEMELAQISRETGLGEDARECLQSLIELGYCFYDFDKEYVWVVDMVTTQMPGFPSPSDSQIKGVHNTLTRLYEEEAPFVLDFISRYRESLSIDSELVTVSEYLMEDI